MKPQIMWAVKHLMDGHLSHIQPSELLVKHEFLRGSEISWEEHRRRGHRIVKVKVEEVNDE